MTAEPSVLLTNDDGIDAPGIRALADELVEVAAVTVVAPASDRSGAGRTRSFESVTIEERERGHAVEGTPVDCVLVGTAGLQTDFDLVVSGVNAGPNVGAHVLGRSGTVGAASEAGFLGLPGIAVSTYGREQMRPRSPAPEDFAHAVGATRFLVEHLFDGGLGALNGALAIGEPGGPDYLNVNAPIEGDDPPMRLTRPTSAYELDATIGEEAVELEDDFWEAIRTGDVEDPVGTDRRAVVDGEVSVSPVAASQVAVEPDGQLVGTYSSEAAVEKL